MTTDQFYERLSRGRGGDSPELAGCINRCVEQLHQISTDMNRPGMLLGKIQSGKTRAFLGIIARAFDTGFDIAIVLTKGTNVLSDQTMVRFKKDFKDFLSEESIHLFDIMEMPSKLTRPERSRKMVFVAKKEKQNLARILKLFDEHEDFLEKKVLLVDDEADAASVRFVKSRETGQLDQGGIAKQMDRLRTKGGRLAFLQVTATPYSLYLQPENYSERFDSVILPKRPAFTELLPIHSAYVGGKDYFGDFSEDDPRYYLHVAVPEDEQDTLRSLDGRRVRADRIFTSKNTAVLRRAIMTFIVGVVVRRLQEAGRGERSLPKFAMVIHNDVKRAAHKFQLDLVNRILESFSSDAVQSGNDLVEAFNGAYLDIEASVLASKGTMPSRETVFAEVRAALVGEEVVVEAVNSDNDVAALLNDDAELKLRTPFNVFIGGNILDRGITVPHLVAFYYGRNPKKMQADTVLQHSRMYGARTKAELSITRFYTSREVHSRLRKIDDLENTLRAAFESGAHDRGVAFITSDSKNSIIPCSPDKIAMSKVVSLEAGGRLLPIEFDVLTPSKIAKYVEKAAKKIKDLGFNGNDPVKVPLESAIELCQLVAPTMDMKESGWDWKAMEAVMAYYCKIGENGRPGKEVWLYAVEGRALARNRKDGRFSNAPDTKQQRKLAQDVAVDLPMLIMFQQEGSKEAGWSGARFWWPVLFAPAKAVSCIYAAGPRPPA